jgi:phosphoribosylglycinamide formyltransferase 1
MADLMIAVFASGGGTNLQALIDAAKTGRLRGKIGVVISNNSNAYALLRAKDENIPAFHISSKLFPDEDEYKSKLKTVLEYYQINLIVLAGYMKLLPIEIIRQYKSRVINIHPALLPKYGGKGMFGINVHKAVIEAGDKISGATVHFVDEIYDHGKILLQRIVPVMPGDTPEELAQRVLRVEHEILPISVEMFS